MDRQAKIFFGLITGVYLLGLTAGAVSLFVRGPWTTTLLTTTLITLLGAVASQATLIIEYFRLQIKAKKLGLATDPLSRALNFIQGVILGSIVMVAVGAVDYLFSAQLFPALIWGVSGVAVHVIKLAAYPHFKMLVERYRSAEYAKAIGTPTIGRFTN